MPQTMTTRQQQATTPTPLSEQLSTHREERRCVLQDDTEREVAQ
jgi:hypothetical protein